MPFVIYPFMITKLNLAGADLLIYAFLYSNSCEYVWRGYRSLGRELNLNVHTVINSVGRLENKKLIEKVDNGYCVKNDTEEVIVSKLTQNANCAKIDTKLKLRRKEKK